MDNTASQDVHKCFDAVWPYLVEKIGVAVDGDPEKIKDLQQAPYTVLQMQSGPTSTSGNARSSSLPTPKSKRNRKPCKACKTRRQKCVPSPTDPDTCERCSQKHLPCILHDRDTEDVIGSPAPSSSALNGAHAIPNFGGVERGTTLDLNHTYQGPPEAMHLAVSDTNFNLTAIPAGLVNPVATSAYANTLVELVDAGAVEGQYNQTWVFSSM